MSNAVAPAAFVPPPPPGVKVPPKPEHLNGILIDMSDLFPTGKKRKKKKLPPWERRKKQPPGQGADGKGKEMRKPWERGRTPAPKGKKSKNAPPIVRAKKGIPPPKAPPHAPKPQNKDAKTPPPSPPPSQPIGPKTPLPLPENRELSPSPSPPPPNATTPPPAQNSSPNKATPAPLSLTALTQPLPLDAQPLPLPPPSDPLLPSTSPSLTPGGVSGVQSTEGAPLPLPTTTVGEGAPPAVGPTVTTTETVEFHGPPAATKVILQPKIVYGGVEQTMEVPPYPLRKEVKDVNHEIRGTESGLRRVAGPVEREKKTKPATSKSKKGGLTCTSTPKVIWRNEYDVQPSPSAPRHFPSSTIAENAACSSTHNPRRPLASEESWRGIYWKDVDVHRYIARRYFGAPPPQEQ